MNLVPLFEEALEFQDYNGTVLSDGKVAVYYIGRTRLADIYEDVAAEYPAENPRILNNLGMGPVYVNPAFDYEMVVFDAYGSELFSVKKYLASKGEHSTANVVVTPSESIAVSAWTVGDVQVYMPYLTGQLGKVYEGIDPIVVNNQVDKISANHVPLGVQDPLYFVQDDEDACIIGFSGGSVDPNEYIPWSASGTFQTAGNYATKEDLNEYTERSAFTSAIESINLNKLDVSSFSSVSSDFLQSSDLNGYATENWVTSQGYLTAETDWSNTITAASANAYNEATAAIPTGLATTADLQTVSGEITALIPSTAGLATESFVTSQGYITNDDITGKQDISGMTAYQAAGNYYSASNPSGFITGVDLTPYQLTADMTAYQAAGNYLSSNALDSLSGNWETVTAKLDTTAFSTVSGTFLTAHQDLSDYQTTAGMTAYQPILTLETGSI